MKFRVGESEKKVYIIVETELRGEKEEVKKCRLPDVMKFIEENDVKVGKLLTDNILTNTNPEKTSAIWMFEKIQDKKVVKKKLKDLEELSDVVQNDGLND